MILYPAIQVILIANRSLIGSMIMNSFTAWAGVAWVNPHTPYLGPLMLMLDMVMLFTPGNRTLLDTLAETNIFSYPIAESS